MHVTYISYYPHYAAGELVGEMKIDANLFCLLLAMARNPEEPKMVTRTYGKGKKKYTREEPEATHLDELFDIIDFGSDDSRELPKREKELHKQLLQFDGETYAFPVMIDGSWDDGKGEFTIAVMKRRPAKILRRLAKDGFIVSEWEEGSHALALPGFEDAAKRAIAELEAKHKQNQIYEELDF